MTASARAVPDTISLLNVISRPEEGSTSCPPLTGKVSSTSSGSSCAFALICDTPGHTARRPSIPASASAIRRSQTGFVL